MRQYLILCLLLISLTPVVALQESVAVYPSASSLNVCACELRQQAVLAENTGSIASSYQLFKSGSAADWLSMADGGFTLQPSERRSVQQFLNIPCSAEGPYQVTTALQTQFGNVVESTLNLNVQQCAELAVKPLTTSAQQSCPCTPVAFTFEVQNNGNGPETYQLKVAPTEYVSITETRFMLVPGERKSVAVYVHAPCEISGREEFSLHVLATHSGLEAIQPFSVDINACYDYGIGVQPAYDICQNVLNTIPITVTNTAAFRNSYQLSVNGISWGTISDATLALPSGATAQTTLLLDPIDAAPGVYTATVDAISDRGELMQSRPIAINLESCYDFRITPESLEPIAVACEDTPFAYLIENGGTKTADLAFGLDAPAFVALEQPTLSLQPSEAKILRQQMRVPCDATDFQTTFAAAIAPLPAINAQHTTTFRVVSMADAYALDISVKNIRTQYDGTTVPVEITNTGVKTGTYKIGIIGPEFAALEAAEITVAPQETVAVNLQIAPPAETPEGAYPLTVAAALVNTHGQVITYERAITVTVRERGMLFSLLPYLVGLLLLALIAFFVFNRGKAHTRKPLIRESVLKAEKPLVKPLRQQMTSRFAHPFKDREIRIPVGFWKWFIVALVLLLAGLGTYFTSPLLSQGVPGDADNARVVRIGDTSLQIFGTTIIVRGPAELPLRMINPDTAATYDVEMALPDWVTTDDDRVTIPPEQERSALLQIDPTDVAPGDYPLTFTISKRGGENVEEQLTLRVVRLMLWQKVLFAIAAGLLLLAILVLLLYGKVRNAWLAFRARHRAPKVPQQRIDRIAAFRFQRIRPFFIPSKGAFQRLRERLSRISWKRALAVLIPLALIVGLVLIALYTPLFQRTAEVAQQSYAEMAERIKAVKPAVIDLTSDRLPDVIYLDEDGVIIPLKIRNDDPVASYLITIREEVDWISTDKQVLDIPAQGTGNVNIAVAPTPAVKEGKYRITVGVTLQNGEELFDKGVVLDYRKSLWKKLLLWGLLVALGILLSAILITVLRRKEVERAHRKGTEVKL